ncbi:MAG: NAD+ synthase [Magnetococcales bacterium]|nr:NAD+ synthase [Magnetococcales bacterium]
MKFHLAMAQVDSHVGALEKNLERLCRAAGRAREMGADLVIFPELVLPGYPPEDLLHKPLFLERLAAVEAELPGILAGIGVDVIYGSVRRHQGGLGNAAVWVVEGVERAVVFKRCLPNYGVFDERRYFVPCGGSGPFHWRGVPVGLTICEDLWQESGPLGELVEGGARLAININASPYRLHKQAERESLVTRRVATHGVPVVYVNLVGGQDELVFDGNSFAVDPVAGIVCQADHCREDLRLLSLFRDPAGGVRLGGQPGGQGEAMRLRGVEGASDPDREVYEVLLLGLRDYVQKNGFKGVVLGLSGGIDSALTAVIAADALGAERVEAVMMPSRFTSPESLEDAAEGARRLGLRLVTLPIDAIFAAFREELRAEFQGLPEDVTEENLQPRIRATLLMALSNKKGSLLLTTGNKSEVSVGYATLYGDMAGGFSVLKDLLKRMVYRLAYARNRWAREAGEEPPIPERVLTKAPTAELRPDQKDTDSLPPYDLLDRILALYVEQEYGLQEIVDEGFDRETVVRVIGLVDRNEYKRRQSPPGVRITRRAFGKDRRYPVTNGFRIL